MDCIIKSFVVKNMLATSGDDLAYFEVTGETKNEIAQENIATIYFNDLVEFVKANEPALGR